MVHELIASGIFIDQKSKSNNQRSSVLADESSDIISTAVWKDQESFNNEDLLRFPSDFLCLINFTGDKADEILSFYGGYVFNFADEETCMRFLKGLCYIRDACDYPYFYLHDANQLIGHNSEGSCLVRSVDFFNDEFNGENQGVISYVLSKDPEIILNSKVRLRALWERGVTCYLHSINFERVEFIKAIALGGEKYD